MLRIAFIFCNRRLDFFRQGRGNIRDRGRFPGGARHPLPLYYHPPWRTDALFNILADNIQVQATRHPIPCQAKYNEFA